MRQVLWVTLARQLPPLLDYSAFRNPLAGGPVQPPLPPPPLLAGQPVAIGQSNVQVSRSHIIHVDSLQAQHLHIHTSANLLSDSIRSALLDGTGVDPVESGGQSSQSLLDALRATLAHGEVADQRQRQELQAQRGPGTGAPFMMPGPPQGDPSGMAGEVAPPAIAGGLPEPPLHPPANYPSDSSLGSWVTLADLPDNFHTGMSGPDDPGPAPPVVPAAPTTAGIHGMPPSSSAGPSTPRGAGLAAGGPASLPCPVATDPMNPAGSAAGLAESPQLDGGDGDGGDGGDGDGGGGGGPLPAPSQPVSQPGRPSTLFVTHRLTGVIVIITSDQCMSITSPLLATIRQQLLRVFGFSEQNATYRSPRPLTQEECQYVFATLDQRKNTILHGDVEDVHLPQDFPFPPSFAPLSPLGDPMEGPFTLPGSTGRQFFATFAVEDQSVTSALWADGSHVSEEDMLQIQRHAAGL